MSLIVNKPSTVYVRFTGERPKLFMLESISAGERYYFRYLDGKTPRIKFNIPDPGEYEANVPMEIVKIAPIEVPEKYPTLPPANRDRLKPVKMWHNPEMDLTTKTPIRIYTDLGVIEYGDRFLKYIPPVRTFLVLHEYGHFFYLDEEKCDLYALVNFLRLGHNQSTAYYALSKILSRTPDNIKRIKTLFSNIQKIRK